MHTGQTLGCPYCGQPTFVPVDRDGGGTQAFVSDCEVCCRPMEVRVIIASDGSTVIQMFTEDD